MIRKFNNYLIELQKSQLGLVDIKKFLLKAIVIFSTIFGLPTSLFAIIESIFFQQYYSILLYSFIILLILSNIVFYRKFSIEVKTINILSSLYLVAIHNFLLWGVSGAAIPLMILMSVLATILLGLKKGILSIVISIIPLIIVGILMVNGVIEVTIDVVGMSLSLVSWVTAGTVLLFVSITSVLSFGIMKNNLINSLKFINIQSNELEETNAKLNEDIDKRKVIEKRLRDRINTTILLNKISAKFIQIKSEQIDLELERSLIDIGEKSNFNAMIICVFSTDMESYDSYFEYNPNNVEIKNSILKMCPKNISWCEDIQIEKDAFYMQHHEDFSLNKYAKTKYSNYVIFPMIYRDKKIGFLGIKKSQAEIIDLEYFTDLRIIKDIFTNIIIHKRSELERKDIQQQLIQSQKLDSIGNLAAGIAHDFNNLLTVIMGNADFLKYKIGKVEILTDLIDDIIIASNKAAELTKKMLLFSRKEEMNFQPLDINQCIIDLNTILKRLISENIKIEIDLMEDNPLIKADKSNIEQVILNIVSNANDAMPDGGILNIITSKISIDENDLKNIKFSKVGDFIQLSMQDNGAGIDKSIVEKIFDPFFTTKEVGKGTGLGLSVVYGIVKKHGGWINAYSETNHGTIFRIYLPLYSGEIKVNSPIKNTTQISIIKKDLKILFIEDDEAVLKFGKKILNEYGYKVDIAMNGLEAKNKFNKNDYKYDLVISDVVLPDFNGVDIVNEFKQKNETVKILMISGYANKDSKIKIINDESIHFLSKPFTNREFLNKINEIVND